ncbi:hypothetical protein [Bacillus sp. M6-12]|uniref:hypothetical protein n=1 Tax=Bacillus sp. M6-12 TaxID=2054166 RepID=UPI0015E129AF|nr:hypothetical protein [Bacillus sp. M6-12]
MREKSPQQIIRFDGKNVFVEVMNSAFGIGKVQLNFIEYDTSKEAKSRQTKNIPMYIDTDKFLLLTQDILSGRMVHLAKQANDAKTKGGYKYAKEIYADLGGISAENLKRRGKERPDGMSMSRQFKITPGDKIPWILSAEIGAGKEDDKGLIVPQGRPEEFVRVALSDDDFKKLAIVVQSHIQAYIASQYESQEVQELKAQLDTIKPIMNGLTEFLRKQGVPVVFPKKDK